MQVIKINNNNNVFKAKNMKFCTNNVSENSLKDALHKNIEEFMNNKYDKKTYITNFIKDFTNQDLSKFTNNEKNYIQNIMMALESVDDYDDIPEGYLKWLINNFIRK